MIVADPKHTDVGQAAGRVAETLREAGAHAVADELLIAVQRDVEDGKVLKTLAVHDNRLYYGRRVLGELP